MQSKDRLSTEVVQSGTILCTKGFQAIIMLRFFSYLVLSYLNNELKPHKILIISKNNRLLTFDVKNYQNINVRQ